MGSRCSRPLGWILGSLFWAQTEQAAMKAWTSLCSSRVSRREGSMSPMQNFRTQTVRDKEVPWRAITWSWLLQLGTLDSQCPTGWGPLPWKWGEWVLDRTPPLVA